MKWILRPKAYLIAQTEIEHDGVRGLLAEYDALDWGTDAESGAEELAEIAGRLCYRSFDPKLNPNLTKVRTGNKPYLGNVIRQRHGSVLEHASVTFAFVGVSRVFTHELVRHRAGTAFSQESLRFVRMEELCAWFPESFGQGVIGELYDALVEAHVVPADKRNKDAWVYDRVDWLRGIFQTTYEELEQLQKRIANMLYLDELPENFKLKKQITSAMRRLLPIGLGTAIVCTANHRTWRHIVDMRTAPGAEEEIKNVCNDVAAALHHRFPNLYQDLSFDMQTCHSRFEYSKI